MCHSFILRKKKGLHSSKEEGPPYRTLSPIFQIPVETLGHLPRAVSSTRDRIPRYQPVEVGITRRLLGSTFAHLG